MNKVKLFVENIPYNIYIIDTKNYEIYEPLLEKLNICSRDFISYGYEHLSYETLYDPGYVGFILTNNNSTIIYASLIIDLKCVDIKDKITGDIISKYNINFDNTISISILCANQNNSIPGLTNIFFKYVIDELVNTYKPAFKNILLYVSQSKLGIGNPRAIKFYEKLGFRSIQDNIMYTGVIEDTSAEKDTIAGGFSKKKNKKKRTKQSIKIYKKNKYKKLTKRLRKKIKI